LNAPASGGGSGGGIDANVVLMLHCDGADGSTSFPDSSTSNPKTVTAQINAQVDTAQFKFGGASLLLDGISGLSIPDDADWNFGAGDFTFDCWFRPDSAFASGGMKTLFQQQVDATHFQRFSISPSAMQLQVQNITFPPSFLINFSISFLSALVADTWYHIAIQRNGITFEVFVDGVSQGTTSDSDAIPDFAAAMNVAVAGLGAISGHLDEIRISKGVARYNGNFTPPTQAYS
jgi:hypothetical protein